METLKGTPVLTFDYVKEFKCVGGACEDNCCKEWRVDIDKNTYLNYRNAFKDNKPLQKKVDECVKRNKRAISDFSYASIVLKQDRNCPFLSETGLCEIQLNSGYGLLSDVCKTYPRTNSIIDGKYELSMTVSCIEVLRKVLFDKNSMQLRRMNITCDSSTGFSTNTKTADPTSLLSHYWAVRAFSFEVLQLPNHPFEHKLALLGIAYSKLSAMQKSGELEGVPAYLDTLLSIINKGEIDVSTLALDNKLIKFQLSEMMLESIITNRGITNQALSKAVLKAVGGLVNREDPNASRDYEQILDNYGKALETYYKPWAAEKGYMVDNFFFNEFFRKSLPFDTPDNVWDSYIQLCTTFALFRYLFAGVALQGHGITDDDVLHVFLGIAKGLQHASKLFEVYSAALDKTEMNTLAHMVLLIS